MPKHIIFIIMAWFVVTAPCSAIASENTPPADEQIPISDIFMVEEEVVGSEKSEESVLQILMLLGLLVSVITVAGSGRAYSQLFSSNKERLTQINQELQVAISSAAIVHDNRFREILNDIERNDKEQDSVKLQLLKQQGEV